MWPPKFKTLQAAFLLALLQLSSACGSSQSIEASIAKLPTLTDDDTKLFNDVLSSDALGLSLEKPSYKSDKTFSNRALASEGIVKLKITTVSVDSSNEIPIYRISMIQVGEPVAKNSPPPPIELEIRNDSLSYGMVKQLENRLGGRTMLGMFKRFRIGNEGITKWYFAPDDPQTIKVAKESILLQELTGKNERRD